MTDEKRALEERAAQLERELVSVREAMQKEKGEAAKKEASAASDTSPVAAASSSLARGAEPSVRWPWIVALVVCVSGAFAAVSPYIYPQLTPQKALESSDPLPDPPPIDIPAPGQRDPHGRLPGAEHYGHDHGIEEDEGAPP